MMRGKLDEIRADLNAIESGGFMLNTKKVWRVVWNLWGLLELIVVQLDRSSTHGSKSEGTDRRL